MKTVISIDLGGTNTRCALVDENLNIVKAVREKTIHRDEDALYDQLHKLITEIINSYTGEEPLTNLGISCSGYVQDGILKSSTNIEIGKLDLVKLIQQDFPNLKVKIANDANCQALMEATYGSTKGLATSFFFKVSGGIGAGLIYDNKLVDLPFECGHSYIGYKNRFYELEQLCSSKGIVKLAKLNNLDVETDIELFTLLAAKDKKARKVYEDWLQLFGSFIANVQITYNPQAIVLSGSLMQSKIFFWNDLLSVANAFCAPFPVRKIRFVPAKFDKDTALISGATLAFSL